jgi:hypothetical protein
MKAMIHAALGAFALGAASLMTAAPAQAATCYYVAMDMTGTLFVRSGRAIKMANACNRARRQCNRQLERWRKQGKVRRGSGCHLLREAGG